MGTSPAKRASHNAGTFGETADGHWALTRAVSSSGWSVCLTDGQVRGSSPLSPTMGFEQGDNRRNRRRAAAEHYGFTDEVPDLIINCDIKYRMGHEE